MRLVSHEMSWSQVTRTKTVKVLLSRNETSRLLWLPTDVFKCHFSCSCAANEHCQYLLFV